ncbi:HTH_Tnp_Tc3_2 domain-containing protein [Trichonephila clavipes]|nr:HTH_Tnp_Tc3_2 domain-containing protein [Trichonephila clavipes]
MSSDRRKKVGVKLVFRIAKEKTKKKAKKIWRELETRYLPSNVRENDHYESRGLMVWAGIKLDGRTHPHVFERHTVTAVRYRDELYTSALCVGALCSPFQECSWL